jgi:hypothetical protein
MAQIAASQPSAENHLKDQVNLYTLSRKSAVLDQQIANDPPSSCPDRNQQHAGLRRGGGDPEEKPTLPILSRLECTGMPPQDHDGIKIVRLTMRHDARRAARTAPGNAILNTRRADQSGEFSIPRLVLPALWLALRPHIASKKTERTLYRVFCC